MIAARRTGWNFGLERAADWARSLGKPLVVLEALRCDYRWASERFHAFVLQGMADNARALAGRGVDYYAYVEAAPSAASGLLASLARRAAVVVSDDWPSFFVPAMLRAASRQIPCRFELIDSNGLFPMRGTDKVWSRAFDFRRCLQKDLLPHLAEAPKANALDGPALAPAAPSLTAAERRRWTAVSDSDLADPRPLLASLPIDHTVGMVADRGGAVAGAEQLRKFLDARLPLYGEQRNQPEVEAASGLSFWLHFGHVSAHQVFEALVEHERWTPQRAAPKPTGSSSGWWGMRADAESFLDELVTWRELGFNMCSKRNDYDRYDSLPDWAQETLNEHAADPRQHVYTLDQFAHSKTHDPLWNAAQQQLVREGRIHNYLRMLWGKKILEWTATPRDALAVMIELNNKYAVDGRNPNSYSGIFWVLGRYDRAWGPERPIYGKIRYMTSENTARKVSVKNYVKRYTAEPERSLF
jgi:deoxyribodipyrimidine photo-lyase